MHKKILSFFLFFFLFFLIKAQETATYTNDLEDYYHALELYHNKAYVAAQHSFNQIKKEFDKTSEMRANCDYYAANCAVRLGQRNADDLMQDFVDNYPNSTKRNDAFMEVANYYYDTGKYSYALKWLKRVNHKNMPRRAFEDYLFRYGYALFSTKNHTASKKYFVQLLDSPQYGAQAKYYYGYIAYQQDDYENADKYLSEASEDKQYKKEVSYYMADMNFKLGKFQKAIDVALPILKTVRIRIERSEINKIIGESYFNLKKYAEAIPYLKEYKGKRGKWVNTDYYLLGYAYYKQNDYENALSNFNKIIDGDNAVAQNAYYHLGECYLKLNKKTEALNAFRNASQMSFKPQVKEDAFLNYAKLSYEIGNPYKSVPEVLQDFLEAYPNSNESEEINDLIISAYVVSKDYKGALYYLENKTKIKDKSLYQKMAFSRGVQLFRETKYAEAITLFQKSLLHKEDNKLTAKALYWQGEANYQLKDYDLALQNYQAFKSTTDASNTDESKYVDYQMGYVSFKKKEYANAITSFESFIKGDDIEKSKLSDAYLRLGDTYFVTSSYNNAIKYYDKSKRTNNKTADYALFQTALSHGFLKNNSKKISLLNKLIATYSRSAYRDDSYFIMGGTHTVLNKTTEALKAYNHLLLEYPKSLFVPRVLLKKGLIYYNNNQNEEALKVYKKTVKKFPNTAFAQEAVRNARQIYVDTGRVDDYAVWVEGLDFINVSNVEIDNDMYESAEKQYVMNEYTKAIPAFKKYLKNFPKGLHALQSHFYLAQAYETQNQAQKTIPHYKFVVQSQNEFTEQSLAKLSQHYLNKDNWDKAIPLLLHLEDIAEHSENTIYAQSNMMKAYYNKEDYTQAVSYAEKILTYQGIDAKVMSDAQIIIARSAIKTENQTKARAAYKNVESIATGILKAEALYYDAYFKYMDGNYKNSNIVVQTIASDYAAYKYWGAKALVVMAKNFYELKDSYQATYILESVIKNFKQFNDVVTEAKTELNKIKKEAAKTNDSVLPE